MKINLQIAILAGCALMSGCAFQKNYQGSDRAPDQLATLVMRAQKPLMLLSVDGIQYENRTDASLSDKRTLLAGARHLVFSYMANTEQRGFSQYHTYFDYRGTCVFHPKHSYIATVRDARLVVLDVGEIKLPEMPMLTGGPEYLREMELIAAQGTPADCKQDLSK